MTLHVFQNDVIDSFVAESSEEARALGVAYANAIGMDPDIYEEMTADDYAKVDDAKEMTIDMEDVDGGTQTKTCAEWCVANGKGFLGSTEY